MKRKKIFTTILSFIILTGCGGGNGQSSDANEDEEYVELPEKFSFCIQLVTPSDYKPSADLSFINVTIQTSTPITFDHISIPSSPPYTFNFEMDPTLSMEVAQVRVDGYRNDVNETFSSGRSVPVKLGNYNCDPISGTGEPLKIFFQRLDTFSLLPEESFLNFPRIGLRADILPDGRIMVIGGATREGITRIIETLDLEKLKFDIIDKELPSLRSEFAMPRISDGKWLIVGGRTPQTSACMINFSDGVFNFEDIPIPEEIQGVWAAPRVVKINDGTFLFGGADKGTGVASPDYVIFDENGLRSLPLISEGEVIQLDKYHPTLTWFETSLNRGVLIYGGGGSYVPSIILDPLTGQLADGGQTVMDMRINHDSATTTIRGGEPEMESEIVLILGGEETAGGETILSENIYIFDPACLQGTCPTGSVWSNAGPAFSGDYGATQGVALTLPNGRVLYIGGRNKNGEASKNVLDIRAESISRFWVAHLSLSEPRVAPAVIWYETTKQLFVIGGEGTGGEPLSSVEVFTPKGM